MTDFLAVSAPFSLLAPQLGDYDTIVLGLSGGAPLAYWRMSNAGSIVDDRPGARHGTWDGTVTLVDGLPQNSDQAAHLPGTVVGTIPHDAGLALAAGSVSLWFRLPAAADEVAVLLAKDAEGNNAGDLAIRIQEGLLHVRFQTGSESIAILTPNIIPVGFSQHVVVTWDTSGFSAWFNGQQIGASTAFTGGWTSNTEPIRLGSADWTQFNANIVLDEIALWSRVLTEAEIITLSQKTALPVAHSISAQVTEGQSVQIDPQGTWVGTPTLQVTQGVRGTSSVSAGQIVYQANADTGGQGDSFTYTIEDLNGTSAPATVTIAIQDESTAPDEFGAMIQSVSGLVAYWRMGDTSAALLADASGNGRSGTYPATPTAFGAGRLTWDAADNRCVNFGGAGYGQVAHNAAFVLPRGTIAGYFRLNSSNQTILQKGSGFNLRVNSSGQLVLTIGSTTFQMQNTAVALIGTGIEYHFMVSWGVKRVRLYLDGRQVAWGMAHKTGLTSTSAWQFARSTGGANANIRLDEIALWNRELSRAEMDKISEYIRGLPYGAPESTVVVSSAAALTTAVNAAPPGRHILVANGTYSFGSRTFSASGQKRRPIVIRPQNNRGDVTFTSPNINISGSWIVIANIYMTSPVIRGLSANSRYNRITRCRFRNIVTHSIDFDATPCGYFWRMDHCDHSGYTNGNNRSFMRVGSLALREGFGKGMLVDHLYAHDISITAGTGGGANEVVGFGTQSRHALPSHPFGTVEHSLFQNVNLPGEGEVVHGKANDTVFDRLTFVNCPGMYVSLRGGWHCQIISVWMENMSGSSGGFNAWGPDHYIAGCRFASSGARAAPAGNVTLQQRIDGAEGYPFALNTQIIGCTGGFSVGSYWSSGQVHPATNVRIEACSPGPTLISGWHTGTSQSGSTSEPFTPAVRLTASTVGMAAADPLVPPGYS